MIKVNKIIRIFAEGMWEKEQRGDFVKDCKYPSTDTYYFLRLKTKVKHFEDFIIEGDIKLAMICCINIAYYAMLLYIQLKKGKVKKGDNLSYDEYGCSIASEKSLSKSWLTDDEEESYAIFNQKR